METDLACGDLDEHGRGSIGLRTRLRKEALCNLALHHHTPVAERGGVLERLDDERGGDVVRKVGDELRRRRAQRRDVDGERIAPLERDVRPLAEDVPQSRLERTVDLDRVNQAHVIREVAREDSETRADLEDDVLRNDLAETADDPDNVLVDEEVLPESLLRRDAHDSANTAAALAWVAAAKPPSTRSPRAYASARSVWTTFAGWF